MIWRQSPVWFAVVLGLAGIMIHLTVPSYIKKVFPACLDTSGVGFNLQVKSPLLIKAVLHNKWLNPVFRAVLYKELVTDRRNILSTGRYILTSLLLLAYLPLSGLQFFAAAGIGMALIFCYLVIVLDVHDGFAAAFAKEGGMTDFLYPRMTSWQFGLAKFTAFMLADLPLVILATSLVWYKLSLGIPAGMVFGFALWLLCGIHLATVVAVTAVTISAERRETGMLAGMLYEQSMGNINPRILTMYMGTLMLPALLVWLLYYVQPLKFSWPDSWFIIVAIGFIVLTLHLGRFLYRRRFEQLIK